MRGQISRDRLASRGSGQIDHGLDQLPPPFTGVSRASRNLVGLMARSADSLDDLLTVAVGQLTGRLAMRREGNNHKQNPTRQRN
jgi:hypothetical protein